MTEEQKQHVKAALDLLNMDIYEHRHRLGKVGAQDIVTAIRELHKALGIEQIIRNRRTA